MFYPDAILPAGAGPASLVKGSWHGAAVAEGLAATHKIKARVMHVLL